MKTSFQTPSTDPSPLYGRVFEKNLRDKIYAKAVEVLGLEPARRDDFVGTEYYVLRLLEDLVKKMVKDAVKAIEENGMGVNSAFASILDFKDMVARESYFPQVKFEKPAPKLTPKPTPKPAQTAKPAPASSSIGEQIGETVVAELNAAVGVIPAPVSAPAAASAAETPIVTVKGKGRKVANG
ncbi:hypothetical protein HYV69_03315 [Candidatus Uhrbacteria bacterium]|nr:hypothetical protein [Candidatus Uhrbacteria bacterium]